MAAKVRARRHSISSPLELEASKLPLTTQQIDAQVIISRKRPADNTSPDLGHVEKRPALADILPEDEQLPSGEFYEFLSVTLYLDIAGTIYLFSYKFLQSQCNGQERMFVNG